MYTSLKIVKKLPYAWIYYPNNLTTGFAVSKGYFTAEEDTGVFQIVEQGKTKRPGVFLDNITLQDESTGGGVLTFTSFSDLQQKLTELGNPLMQISSGTALTGDELAAIQNANMPSSTNPFVTMEDVADSGVLADTVLISTGYSIVGNDITFNSGWVWRINGIEYSNPIAVIKTMPFALTGLSRFDKFAGNTSNTFLRIEGDESDTYIPEPDLLPNTVQVCMILVTDSTIDEVTPPMTGDIYVKKIESQDYIANYGVTLVIDQIDLIDDRSSISLIGNATDVKSVQISSEFIRPGKPHFFKNRTNHNVTLWHLAGTGNVKYFFPNSLNLVVKPNEVIEFNTNTNDSSNMRFEYIGSDLSNYSKTELCYACSDETSDLAVGTVITFRMPHALTLASVRLSLNNAPTISKLIVDIKMSGTSIFSTLPSIDTSQTTSVGASVPAVISNVNLVDDSVIVISITQIGSGSAGKGLKVTLMGKKL